MTQRRLEDLVRGAPLVVCLGPGGVGKTTLSAVLALHQAAAGHQALVLTIDPARRLADALDLAQLSNDPAQIRSYGKMHPEGELWALMLDPSATFDRLISALVTDPQRQQALLQNRVYQYMSRYLAGTLEYMAVERLHDLLQAERFSSIVLDTPPTSNALDFIEAPDRLATFFSERVIRRFSPQPQQGSWASRLWSRASSSVSSLMGKVGGDSFLEDTMGFVGAFGDLFGAFRARGQEVGKALRHKSTVFIIVCSADPQRVEEAQTIDRKLREAGCTARAFVVNRVDTPFLPAEEDAQQTLDRAAVLLGDTAARQRVQIFIERLETMRQAHDSGAAVHQQAVARLQQYAGKRPVFTAPRVPAGESPRAALLALYVGLFAETADLSALEREETRRTPAPPPGGVERRRGYEPRS